MVEFKESHFIASWREFRPTLEDIVSLTTLSLYVERKPVSIVLEEDYERSCSS